MFQLGCLQLLWNQENRDIVFAVDHYRNWFHQPNFDSTRYRSRPTIKIFFVIELKQLGTRARFALQPLNQFHEYNQFLPDVHEMLRVKSERKKTTLKSNGKSSLLTAQKSSRNKNTKLQRDHFYWKPSAFTRRILFIRNDWWMQYWVRLLSTWFLSNKIIGGARTVLGTRMPIQTSKNCLSGRFEPRKHENTADLFPNQLLGLRQELELSKENHSLEEQSKSAEVQISVRSDD